MIRNILKLIGVLGFATVVLNSCGPKSQPPLVYFPDMYFPVAYDPLMKTGDAYSKHENEIPLFVKQGGATGLSPVDGTVSQNNDGVVDVNDGKQMTMPVYNEGYEASKTIASSPLAVKNAEKDLERGKVLYDRTCAVCHGTGGDGQGPIVQSGAYQGVPNYKDRELTVGSVHYVITHGRNAMGSHAGQLNSGDRWRVAMYVMNEFKGGVTQSVASEEKAAAATTEGAKETTPTK